MANMEPSGPPRSSLQPPPPTGSDAADPNSTPPALAAMSRFEFETNKGNEGTKILMVEWDASPVVGSGDWEVSWEGKSTVLRTRDQDAPGDQKRVYFLLPPGAPVPPLVTIAPARGQSIETKPLPALFPPSLGVSNKDVGRRGVLHTIWAKKRLLELQDEIKTEMRTNGESVGLEMALQESRWIQEHFGIGEYTPTPSLPLPSPMTPRSPAGGRLGEKLRGLKLATSPADLAPGQGGGPNVHFSGFSPVDGDIAISSFASFPGRGLSKPAAQDNPVSLDAALSAAPRSQPASREDLDMEEDLFALPMSPRSPEMKKSPFSLL